MHKHTDSPVCTSLAHLNPLPLNIRGVVWHKKWRHHNSGEGLAKLARWLAFYHIFCELYSQQLLCQQWRLQKDMAATLALCKLWSTPWAKCAIAQGDLPAPSSSVWYGVPRVASATLVHTAADIGNSCTCFVLTSSKTTFTILPVSVLLPLWFVSLYSVKRCLCRTTVFANCGHHCVHGNFWSTFTWQLHFRPLTQ